MIPIRQLSVVEVKIEKIQRIRAGIENRKQPEREGTKSA